jgi:hypothetical protein
MIDWFLGGKSKKKQVKDPLRDLFGISKKTVQHKPKQNVVNNNFLKSFVGVSHPKYDRKTKQQKQFLNKTRMGTGKSHKRFWDHDGDGVISGLDCMPKNSKRHMAWRRPEPYEFVRYLTPEDYIKKAGGPIYEGQDMFNDPNLRYYDTETEKMEPIKKLAGHVRSPDKQVDLPFVDPDTTDHEGRHRAVGGKLAGYNKIPVVMPPPRSWRTDKVAESFIEKRFPGYGESNYLDNVKRRIQEEPFPYQRLDRESRIAYAEAVRENMDKYELEQLKRNEAMEKEVDEKGYYSYPGTVEETEKDLRAANKFFPDNEVHKYVEIKNKSSSKDEKEDE